MMIMINDAHTKLCGHDDQKQNIPFARTLCYEHECVHRHALLLISETLYGSKCPHHQGALSSRSSVLNARKKYWGKPKRKSSFE